uniref:Uncharacterized protein n=1 Tax=Oryza sativa subsp. japonica TaxID=39947 RepID=Q2QZF7_ORYSJ|nr:hypothetical protein LOC_Os11g46150 [Oryza sativa Japonica Group]
MPAAALALSTDPSSSSRLRFPSLASLPSLSSTYAAAPASASARTPNAVPPVAAATTATAISLPSLIRAPRFRSSCCGGGTIVRLCERLQQFRHAVATASANFCTPSLLVAGARRKALGTVPISLRPFFAPTIMRRDHCAILRRCCREVEMRPRGSHVCR